ncbi:MAG: biopolymer transporter ExbD [Chlamydiia bacterium]|nr:biopolymer transporter ExbD [Chlamydiia bacterium]
MRRRPPPFLEEDLSEEPLINLTPLIDVVFVVLIAFMLIAPILDVDSILLAPSGSASKKETPPLQNGPVSISIRKDNSIWLEGKRVSLLDLEKRLTLERKRAPHMIPQMLPDASAHFATYQQVKNVIESCGFEQVDIVLRPP